MQSNAETVEEYINELPLVRRDVIRKVREVILKNLPDGLEEVKNWGMIAYQVPLSVYSDTYNGKPLMFAALTSQKNHMAVYLSSIYADEQMRAKFEVLYRATGKNNNVGKSCVRFRKLEDLPLDVLAQALSWVDMAGFVNHARRIRSVRNSSKKQS